MDWRDIFLGLVQGVTEFLPISSSGHLFVMEKILKGSQSSLTFVLLLHLATLFAIVTVFFKDIKNFTLNLKNKTETQLLFKILLSLLPLVFVGLFLKDFVKQSFEKNFIYTGCQILNKNLFNEYEVENFSVAKIWNKLLMKQQLNGFESINKFHHLTNLEIFKKLKGS